MRNKNIKYLSILFTLMISFLLLPTIRLFDKINYSNQEQTIVEDDVTIDGTLSVFEVTASSVTVDYTYTSGAIPVGIAQTVLVTDEIEIANLGSFGESGRQTFNGLDPATTYTNATLKFVSFTGENYILEPTDGRLSFTTLNSDLEIDYLNASIEDDSTTGYFDFNLDYNGSTVNEARIVDEAIELNQVVTTVDGQNAHSINFFMENFTINAQLIISYDLDGETKETSADFNSITTGNIVFSNEIANIQNVTNTSASLYWSFSTSEDIVINSLAITGKEDEVEFTKYTLSQTTNYGYETITTLNPNSSYTDLSLEINYNNDKVHTISIDEFSTAQDAPEFVSASWSLATANTATFTWNINSNGNSLSNLTLRMNDKDVDLGFSWSGTKIIRDLDPNTTYYNSIVVEYEDINSISKEVTFDMIPALTTVSGEPEKIIAEFDNIGPDYVRFNWNLNSYGSTIDKLTLECFKGDDTSTQLTHELSSNFNSGREQITGLEANTTYTNITLRVDYTNTNDIPRSTTINVVDSLTTLDLGPTIASFDLNLGNQWGYLSYEINAGLHTIDSVSLVGTSYSLADGTSSEYSVYIGSDVSKTDYLLTNFDINHLYSNMRLEITYDSDKITYSNLEDGNQHNFITNNYIKSSVYEAIGTTLIGQVTLDPGVRTMNNVLITIEDLGFSQNFDPISNEISFIVPISLSEIPESIQIDYVVSFDEGDDFSYSEIVNIK